MFLKKYEKMSKKMYVMTKHVIITRFQHSSYQACNILWRSAMHHLDIRNQGQNDKKNRLSIEVAVILLMITTVIFIMLENHHINNPFKVLKPSINEDLTKRYEEGVRYLKVDSAELVFTGYYREDEKGNIKYNCFKTSFGDMEYFVFVPVKRSGGNPENPSLSLENYSFLGKLEKGNEILDYVAKNYDISVDDFMKEYQVSSIIINEANSDRTQMIVLWCVLFLLICLGMCYIISLIYNYFIIRRKID